MNDLRLAQSLFRAILAITALSSVDLPAYAQGGIPGYPENIGANDPREVAMLPNWCIYTQGMRQTVPGGADPAKIEYWKATMGRDRNGQPIFEAMHHYCAGLMKTNRAILLARTRQVRTFYLGDSIREFDYVIDRAPPTFVLMPEILTKKGENLIRLGRVPQGFQLFEQAIQLKPDYWPPYAYMSDHYKLLGDLKKAREPLDRGLLASPDAKALKTRLTELGAAREKRKTEPPATEAPAAPKPPASK